MGRPNTGKSTLFNRLIRKKRSLVYNEPGVTRDCIESVAQWWTNGELQSFLLVDTGGMAEGDGKFLTEIDQKIEQTLKEAHLILWVLDSKEGITQEDWDVLKKIRERGVLDRLPLFAVINKIDHELHEERVAEFYTLGLDHFIAVSAEHGLGITELEEKIVNTLITGAGALSVDNSEQEESAQRRSIRIAIVGRPNVGKSTIINTLLGYERAITSSTPGTTVDPIDSLCVLDGFTSGPITLIDTAGIRRKNKTTQGIEVLSVVQTRKILKSAHVALFVVDGASGITEQDEKLAHLIEEFGCSLILIVNKWDMQQSNKQFTRQKASETIRSHMPFLKYVPILFVSALKKKGFESLGSLLFEILEQRKLRISTRELTEWMKQQIEVHNPMNAKIYLCHQGATHPPTFVCRVNDPEKLHFSTRRNLMNAFRERWNFMGTPVRMIFTGKEAKK